MAQPHRRCMNNHVQWLPGTQTIRSRVDLGWENGDCFQGAPTCAADDATPHAWYRVEERGAGLTAPKSQSENRPRRRGQEHFAPKAPQTVPDPDGFRIGSLMRSSTGKRAE